jgi:hypothetical protein
MTWPSTTVDRPAGERAGDLGDVLLRVAAVDAQRVQLHQLAAVVLVEALGHAWVRAHAGTLSRVDVEVVEPEVHEHFLQLAAAVDGAENLLLLQILHDAGRAAPLPGIRLAVAAGGRGGSARLEQRPLELLGNLPRAHSERGQTRQARVEAPSGRRSGCNCSSM